MRTATFPSVRTTPATRELAQSVLNAGETLSQFIEDSLKRNIEHRQADRAFIARGLAARDEAKQSGQYVSVAHTMARLRAVQAASQAATPLP
jgi:hypothetical protein